MNEPSFDDIGPAPVGAEDESAIFRLGAIALKGRRWFFGIPIASALMTVAIVLILPLHYTTVVSFRPVISGGNVGELAGLASQFGLALPGTDPSASADFYADLIRTPQLLSRLARARYHVERKNGPIDATFIDLYEISESTPGRTLSEAIRVLDEDILTVRPNRTTSVVSVSVETDWPDLSRQMAEQLLTLLDEFNVASRQYQADAEHRFMEQRLDTAVLELRNAENRLEEFLKANKEFRGDPQLLFQYERLSRDVTSRQTVYTTLLQIVEQMRIEAVRNTPSISIIEQPAQPLRPDRRHVPRKALLALSVGIFLSLALLFLQEFKHNAEGRQDSAFMELQSEWIEARRSLGALFARRRA